MALLPHSPFYTFSHIFSTSSNISVHLVILSPFLCLTVAIVSGTYCIYTSGLLGVMLVASVFHLSCDRSALALGVHVQAG